MCGKFAFGREIPAVRCFKNQSGLVAILPCDLGLQTAQVHEGEVAFEKSTLPQA